MILSGPKDCRGSTNEARILPVFLHSPGGIWSVSCSYYVCRCRDLLLIDEGRGLLMSGILGDSKIRLEEQLLLR